MSSSILPDSGDGAHAVAVNEDEFEHDDQWSGVAVFDEPEPVWCDALDGNGARAEALRAQARALRSHARIAHLAAAENLGRLLYVVNVGWHVWTGKRFEPDGEDKLATKAVVDTIAELSFEALGDKDLYADLKQSQSSNGVRGVLSIMGSLNGIRATVDDLDADPLLLNVDNGVLDLRGLESPSEPGVVVDWRTLTLRPHDPAYRMTHIARAAFDSRAVSETWEEFLAKSLPDTTIQLYLREAAGLGLVGEQLEHLLVVFEGEGRNGKGVCYGAMHHSLGTYSHVAEASIFDRVKGDPNRPNPAMLALRGKRLVFASETAKSQELDAALIKRLTGGDPITGTLKYKNEAITFAPSHQLFLITNFAPQLPADDPAVWDRVRRAMWDVVIPPDERDPHLGRKLQSRPAMDAILGWALAGLADYRAHGLTEPQSITDSTNAYKADQDTVSRFLAERCDACPDDDGDAHKVLHADYRRFCRADGVLEPHILGDRDFGKRLDALGHPNAKGTGGRRFRRGVRLLPSDDDVRAAEANAHARERSVAQRTTTSSSQQSLPGITYEGIHHQDTDQAE